ncbi:MAG: molybdenum cofactor biosynthesis protein MoaE [Longimicrobiales bacterium]|nr:molybdenum cofactor biosynthesis protein MoaE [Longimicrobiales bacterium]
MLRTAIVLDPIVPEDVLAEFSSPQDGVCLLFLGVVRDHHQGRVVTGLDYEVYQGMAEKTLAAIAAEASHSFGTDRVAILHRVGELRVGDVSTAIAVATPHRGEAYDASRFIIEEIKQRLPIWKREHYLEGDSDWVGGNTDPGGEGRKPDGFEEGGMGNE